jgi:hypothetical protein
MHWARCGLEGEVDLDAAICEASHETRLAEIDLCKSGLAPPCRPRRVS